MGMEFDKEKLTQMICWKMRLISVSFRFVQCYDAADFDPLAREIVSRTQHHFDDWKKKMERILHNHTVTMPSYPNESDLHSMISDTYSEMISCDDSIVELIPQMKGFEHELMQLESELDGMMDDFSRIIPSDKVLEMTKMHNKGKKMK